MLATALKTGTVFKDKNDPFVVVKYTHVKTARGGATVRVKAKNLITGSVLEKSFLSSAKVEDANVYRKSAQYLYENNGYVFMDPENYEQFVLSKKVLGDQAKFLKEGEELTVMYFEDTPVLVDLPNSMTFKITYTEPGFKGNTVTNVYKDATLENGLIIKVPPFLKIGDKIKVDTRSCEYMARV